MQYSLVGSRFVLQYKLYCEPGWACVTIKHGLGSWGAGVGAGRQGGRAGRQGGRAGCRWARRALGAHVCWASGRRLAAGAGVQAGARQAERAAGWASGSKRAGHAAGAAAGARGTQQAREHGMDALGRAAGAGRGVRGGRLGGLCTSGVRSWARLGVLVHLTQFFPGSTRYFSRVTK